MAEGAQAHVIDIETELTCSICTELLYQPLTLLDCLHTFCGSCLKEWFSAQASRAPAGKANPFSCPSCRAPVRETRPNATVTTLLEMFMKVNPGKERSAEEKEAIGKSYKFGDNVMPRIEKRSETAEEVEDRRMVEEVQQMSLRDVGVRGSGYARGVRHRGREEPASDVGVRSEGSHATSATTPIRASAIGHQNSLRSIISSSDLGDTNESQEEIMRQIIEDGLLDGIDINHLSVAQEEELTEKIAEAYGRRRRRRRSREREHRHPRSDGQSQTHDPAEERQRDRTHTRSSNREVTTPTSPSHPRAHLLSPAYPTGERRNRRHSNETRRHNPPSSVSDPRVPSAQRPAARSATDLTMNSARPHSHSSHDSGHQPDFRAGRHQTTSRSGPHSESVASPQSPRQPTSPPDTDARSASEQRHTQPSIPPPSTVQSPTSMQHESVPQSASRLYTEPSISCKRCSKPNLQYTLHWHCSLCNGGSFEICNHCYLSSRGCNHWYGFGSSALQRYKRSAPPKGYPAGQEAPHQLTSQRYLRPQPSSQQSANTTTSNPATRLQSGPFCSNCSTFTPTQFWACDTCNEGDWRFCNTCVNTAACCTHALLPLSCTPPPNPPPSSPSTPLSPSPGGPHPLSIATTCNTCTYPIPPTHTRFHCPVCNGGDYDLCQPCYAKAQKRGAVPPRDGTRGWRRCPQGGHRMQVVGFEDGEGGQRRIVVQDLVGGYGARGSEREGRWRWEDGAGNGAGAGTTAAAQHVAAGEQAALPPSGGAGMCVLALWSYWPAEGVTDELGFPRGAEIRECEDINGDWFAGVYCKRRGLFPGPYGRVVGRM